MRHPVCLGLSAAFCFFTFSANAQAPAPSWWDPVVQRTVDLPLEQMEKVMTSAYRLIDERSLKPVTSQDLAYESIKSLSTLDKSIGIYKDGKRLSLILNGKILKSWDPPEPHDSANWARLFLASLVLVRPYTEKVRQADSDEILNIVLNATLASIDRYSHYNGPDPAEREKNPAASGFRFRRIGKYLEITDILPESPAARSVLAVGDRISRIDRKDVATMSRIEILNALQGEANSPVTLDVRKDGKMITVTLTRAVLPSGDITYFFDKDSGILTLKIPAFTEKTHASLLYILNSMDAEKTKSVVVDLRGNTGGLLRAAVLCADLFLPENTPLLTTKGRVKDAVQEYGASAKENVPKQPLIILIDGKTASSAEFFAGVLQDTGRAVLIGTPTFGKAKIQTSEKLPNDGEMFFTWAQYYLPSGYTPEAFGVYPNICLSSKNKTQPEKDLDAVLPKNEEEKGRLDALCPPQSRIGETAEDDLAVRLTEEPALYEKISGKFFLDSNPK